MNQLLKWVAPSNLMMNHISNTAEYTSKIVLGQLKFQFKKFDFEHNLAILYSSGTTGKPKCICHRTGGVLLQHLKEHQLHCNIKENENIFYFTTCGWMMWNWLVSSLSSKASIVLFDGFPMYKRNDLLIRIADKFDIDIENAILKKMELNNKKYPIALSKGNATKYNKR